MLITGASGALGQLVARHLAATGRAGQLLLLSRRGTGAADTARLSADLAELGVTVTTVACDVADRPALAAVIGAVPAQMPLRAVVHTAGVLDDATIGSLTPARVDGVLRPKADGAWHLHELTRDLGVSDFVLFSSAAGIMGSAGQANYAAANTFLDTLAAHRRGLGLPATSLAWGAWEQAAGMAGQLAAANRQRIARNGLVALTDVEGLALLDAAASTTEALLVPARLDIAALSGHGQPLPPLLSGLVRPGRRVAAPATGPGGLATRLAAMSAPEQESVLRQIVLTQVARVLGMPGPDAVDPTRPLREARLRLAHRDRPAKPADRGVPPAAAGHGGVRLSDACRADRLPAGQAGPPTRPAPPPRSRSGPRRTSRSR